MIQLNPSLALDSTTMWIITIAVILVFSLHFYLRRLMAKPSRAEPALATISSAAKSANPVPGEPRTNVKR